MCNFSALALLDDFPLPQFSLKYPKLLLTYLALILRFFSERIFNRQNTLQTKLIVHSLFGRIIHL